MLNSPKMEQVEKPNEVRSVEIYLIPPHEKLSTIRYGIILPVASSM